MASTFKTLLNNDVVSTRSMLHEAIPITGTIVSGTYTNGLGAEYNIKNYSHGMFQSIFDYPYLSSSANHIFDLTVGYSNNSDASSSTSIQNSKKINIYNNMAQVLAGYTSAGAIRDFDMDGDLSDSSTDTFEEVVFINLSRLLAKDEIKKQSFSLTVLTGGTLFIPDEPLLIQDSNALTSYKTNSPAGEFGLLYSGSADGSGPDISLATVPVGHIYYQAGIAVITASVFGLAPSANPFGMPGKDPAANINGAMTGSEISGACNGIRNRFYNLSFNNTTELNSTIYFCRANNSEFNYSSNPTYLSDSQIRVKNDPGDTPVSYITTIGLYSADNELLAVAKLSEPLKKSPDNEFTLRVRLDY